MTFCAIQMFMRFSVSPPLGMKRTLPRFTAHVFALTHERQRSSVTIVTSHPNFSAMPMASATKGWTSPRVPRESIMTCLG